MDHLKVKCPGCGRRYEVDASLAGRRARCRHCGTALILEPSGSGTVAGGRVPRQPMTWVDAATIQRPALPLSVEDEPSSAGDAGSPPAVLASAGVGRLRRGLAWLNESAYLISMPFVLVLLMGVVVHSRPLVYLGAAVVVLLNLWRLVSGLYQLIEIPFRESLTTGLQFLVPPYTLYYLFMNWERLERPARRVLEGTLTIFAVILTFALVPWVVDEEGPAASLKPRLEAVGAKVPAVVRGTVERVAKEGGRSRGSGTGSGTGSASSRGGQP